MAEVFQVSREYLSDLWPACVRLLQREPLGLELTSVHQRLLLGEVAAWLAISPDRRRPLGLVLTERSNPGELKVYLVGGRHIEQWIQNAAARLIEYARLQGRRKLRIMCRKGWIRYARRFERPDLQVLFSRDRPTERGHGRINKVGYYRGVDTCSVVPATTTTS
jgi:hypothetical protein